MAKFKFSRKWVYLLIALGLLSPLGIDLANGGDAWGEWGNVGSWTPWKIWTAPFDGYDVNHWSSTLMSSFGYIISALVGIAAILLVTYLVFRLVGKREEKEEKEKVN